jgi:hypothetical protein
VSAVSIFTSNREIITNTICQSIVQNQKRASVCRKTTRELLYHLNTLPLGYCGALFIAQIMLMYSITRCREYTFHLLQLACTMRDIRQKKEQNRERGMIILAVLGS